MNGSRQTVRSRIILFLGLGFIVGCHQSGSRLSRRESASNVVGGPTKPITRSQEADVQISLGRAAEQRGAFDEAMAAYKDALTRDKRRADAYQRLAILHDRKGEFRQSAEMYQKALSLAPGNAEIYCDMGYSLFLQRRWAESERNLKQAISIRPDFARAYNNLGLVLAQDHRDKEALAAYRRAGNDESKALGNLATALTLAGRFGDARDQYQRILSSDPKSTVAQARLKEVNRLIAQSSPSGVKGTSDREIARASYTDPDTSPNPKQFALLAGRDRDVSSRR